MKKSFIVFSIAALALFSAIPALAHEGGDDNGLKLGKVLNRFEKQTQKLETMEQKLELRKQKLEQEIAADQFILGGTVSSFTTSSMIITVQKGIHLPTLTNNQASVAANANTKVTNKPPYTFADIKVGDHVLVIGKVSGTTLTANRIHVMNHPKMEKSEVFGEIIAKTTTNGATTAVTVKNNVTGTFETVTVNADTKVKINGEVKTTADIGVGDRGWVRYIKNQAGTLIAKVINLFR